MTLQEIYNKVKQHLLTQNRRSLRHGETSCAYRGDDGTKCAVGCLIPDDLYDNDMEGWAVDSTDIRAALTHAGVIASGADREKLRLLHCLQNVHDTVEVADWPHRLADVAKDFNLEP